MISDPEKTAERRRRRLLRVLGGVLAAAVAGWLLWWYMRWDRPGGGGALPTALRTAAGLEGKRKWSSEAVPYPGFELPERYRVWSHQEIAQRHKVLVLRDLPEYVTELRGCAPKKETPGTDAGWYFVVPQKHLKEFEDYLVDMGIPREALRQKMYIPHFEYREWDGRPPAVPATQLLFGTTQQSMGEGSTMGMAFGLSSETYNYYLINPNLGRATARITVAWKTGNVQFCELPRNPDGD